LVGDKKEGKEGHALGVGARHVTDREEHVSSVLLYRERTRGLE
jgi:hypothetical protein